MVVSKRKPTSPGQRHVVTVRHPHLHKGRPEKSLITALKRTGGRNNTGRITVRHRGGRHKRLYRLIDFKRNKDAVEARVVRIEYDPNRSAHIALLMYQDNEKRYIIAPKGLAVGDVLMSGQDAPIRVGNAMALGHMPLGSTVHCVEMKPGKGAQLARTAGSSIQLMAVEGGKATLKMPSKEIRRVPMMCRATLGTVSNDEHRLRKDGKAGRQRWRGVRPTVRGVAMNPVDHPHGGGEGKNKGRHPVSKWGQPAKGKKTVRRRHKDIIQPRKR